MSQQEKSEKQADTRSPEEIERDIADTREDLEETLEALGAKLDVKTRATTWGKDTAERTKHQAVAVKDEHGTELAVAAGVATLVVVVLLVRRSRWGPG